MVPGSGGFARADGKAFGVHNLGAQSGLTLGNADAPFMLPQFGVVEEFSLSQWTARQLVSPTT